jgi:hypothetical protein
VLDAPGVATAKPGDPDSLTRTAAEEAWHAVTASIAGTAQVRISLDGGRTYPARHGRPLPLEPPARPCTVPVYDPGSGTGRMLGLDLDAARDQGAGDPAAEASTTAEVLARLVTRLGGRCFTDAAPGGGRHVYVLFAEPLPWRELRDLAGAIALRFPAVGVAPMSSLGGQISPPGSPHRTGGWRMLTCPPQEAEAAARQPNGPQVWNALLAEFAAELRQGGNTAGVDLSVAELDDLGAPWIPRLGGRAPLGAGFERMARTGRYDRSRYPRRREARMAVLAAAVAHGWKLADVEAATSGAWPGFAKLYERQSEPDRMGRLLPNEWRRAVCLADGEKNGRHTHETFHNPHHLEREPISAAEYGLISQWVTAVACAQEDPERIRRWGRQAITVRLVLHALGQAAMMTGSSVIEFGCRNLALHAALSHITISRALELLRSEPDPLIDLRSRRQLARADRYALRIPGQYASRVRWRRCRAGRMDPIHPVFLELGGTAAIVYQVLGQAEARGAEVARAAGLSKSTTSVALRVLVEHGLAERASLGWRRGGADLNDVAESTGAAHRHGEQAVRYQMDRDGWRARL